MRSRCRSSARAARRHNKMKLAVALALAWPAPRAPPRGPRDPRHRPHGRRAPQPADGQVRHGPGRPRQVRGPAPRQDPGRNRLHRRRLHGALKCRTLDAAREAGRRPPPSGPTTGPRRARRPATTPRSSSCRAPSYKDPFRGGDNILVLCGHLRPRGQPAPDNPRAPRPSPSSRPATPPPRPCRFGAGVHALQP